MTTPQRVRASDQDRHEAVLALSDHHAEGRLDLAEFTLRMEQAQEAVYLGDLDPLFTDLPTRRRPEPALTDLAGRAGDPHGHRHCAGWGVRDGTRHSARYRIGPPPWLPVALLVVLGLSVAAAVNGHAPWWLLPIAWVVAVRFAARRRHADRPWPAPLPPPNHLR